MSIEKPLTDEERKAKAEEEALHAHKTSEMLKAGGKYHVNEEGEISHFEFSEKQIKKMAEEWVKEKQRREIRENIEKVEARLKAKKEALLLPEKVAERQVFMEGVKGIQELFGEEYLADFKKMAETSPIERSLDVVAISVPISANELDRMVALERVMAVEELNKFGVSYETATIPGLTDKIRKFEALSPIGRAKLTVLHNMLASMTPEEILQTLNGSRPNHPPQLFG